MTQSPKSPVLEACPYCGKAPRVFTNNCACDNTDCQNYGHSFLIDAWNNRPLSPRQQALEEVAKDMAAALIRYPVFHRCAFPNAANFESCLSCAADAALQKYNILAKPEQGPMS